MPVSASWRKRFSDHFAARPSLKKARVQKIFSSLQVNCSRARHKYNVQELRKAHLELRLLKKSGGEGSFGLVHCLNGDGDQREFDLETRVTTNGNIIISEMLHSCALNK